MCRVWRLIFLSFSHGKFLHSFPGFFFFPLQNVSKTKGHNVYIHSCLYWKCCNPFKQILFCRGRAQTEDIVYASIVHEQGLVTGISSKQRQESENAFSVAWTVKSIMLLINVALSSNVFLSFHSLSVSYPFCFSPFIIVFPLQMSSCERPIHFLCCHLLDVAARVYDFVKKQWFWLILDTRIIFRNTGQTNTPFEMKTCVVYSNAHTKAVQT